MHETSARRLYRQALRHPPVWRRAARLGLIVGILQASLNQGDHWLRHEITTGLVLKTLISPLLSFTIALVSAAGTHVENLRRTSSSSS
jgi:hypothetical protein